MLLSYDTPDGQYTASWENMKQQLSDVGVELIDHKSYVLDVAKIPQTAAEIGVALKEANATTVIFTGDPIMPRYFTEQATDQGSPECDGRPRCGGVRGHGIEQDEENQARRQQHRCVLPTRLDRGRPAQVGRGHQGQHRETAQGEGFARPPVRGRDEGVNAAQGDEERSRPRCAGFCVAHGGEADRQQQQSEHHRQTRLQCVPEPPRSGRRGREGGHGDQPSADASAATRSRI